MKTKPPTSNSSSTLNSSSSKSNTRKSSHSKDRDKKRSGPSGESGASSQCDTPPLNEKESLSHGKFAGISPESVQCMGEQVISEQFTSEACANLAEDVSYKLRQLINNIALHARQTNTQKVDVDDVNNVLRLMDSEPILGPSLPQWISVGDTENLCTTVDPIVDVTLIALQEQTFLTVVPPTLSTAWITDNKNLAANSTISLTLQNYYTKISRAILSNNKRLARVALNDISTNTHIGPIVPNLINLSILVLSEECIPVLAPGAHQILHGQALNMLDSLLINPCCADTDVTMQLQSLFHILVSNVLTESCLSDQMCRIMSSVIQVWPHLAHIGRSIVLEYLAQGVQERLSAPLVTCLAALGRQALVNGLSSHLELIESKVSGANLKLFCPGLYEAICNSSHIFIGPTSQKFDAELAYIDAALYEIMGDAVIPRRIHCLCPEKSEDPPPEDKIDYDESLYSPPKPFKRKSKVKLVSIFPMKQENGLLTDSVFEGGYRPLIKRTQYIHIRLAGGRPLQVRQNIKTEMNTSYSNSFPNGNRFNLDRKIKIPLANGLLTRFKYKLPGEKCLAPNFSFYTL